MGFGCIFFLFLVFFFDDLARAFCTKPNVGNLQLDSSYSAAGSPAMYNILISFYLNLLDDVIILMLSIEKYQIRVF